MSVVITSLMHKKNNTECYLAVLVSLLNFNKQLMIIMENLLVFTLQSLSFSNVCI